MKRILTFIFMIYSIGFYAQKNYTITGKITEKLTGQPIEFATITLENKDQKSKLLGTISTSNGSFSLEAPEGVYALKISFFSFTEYTQDHFVLNKSVNLGTITLEENTTELDAVEVVAQQSTVEMRLDKKIYNVGSDMTIKGGSVTDALGNVPSVSVDLEGNISLRGSENVKILINGKPSALSGIDNQTLQQIPSESIEKIEVITNPSSRYEAQGSSGIINIILKKGKGSGFTGSASLNLGTQNTYGASVNLNYRKNRWNIFNTTSARYSNHTGSMLFEQTILNNNQQPKGYQTENRKSERKRKNITSSLGVGYLFDQNTSVTGNFIFNVRNQNENVITYFENLDSLKNISSKRNRNTLGTENGNNFQYSLNFTKKFNNDGHELTADYQHSVNNRPGEENIEEYLSQTPKNLLASEENITNISVKNHLFEINYTLPLGKNTQFETGYRGNLSQSIIDYNFTNNNNQVNEEYVFTYKENIQAAYAQLGSKINHWNFSMGLRAENTAITSILLEKDSVNDFSKRYFKFFPSVFVGYTFDDQTQLNINYSRRLQRPHSRMLNPFVSRTGSNNRFSGNPDLDANFTDSYEAGVLKRWGNVSFNSSVYYRKTSNIFSFVQTETGETINVPDSEGKITSSVPVIMRKPINLATEKNFGVEFTTSYSPFQNWRIMWDLNLFKRLVQGEYSYKHGEKTVNQSLNSSNYSWFSRINLRVPLPFDIDMQTLAMYMGGQKDAQEIRKGVFSIDLAFSKDILNRKGSISLNINDLLNSRKMISDTQTANLLTHAQMQWRPRQFMLNFTYRFGSNNNTPSERKNHKKQNANTSSQFGEEMAF